jgi:Sel1 repeat
MNALSVRVLPLLAAATLAAATVAPARAATPDDRAAAGYDRCLQAMVADPVDYAAAVRLCQGPAEAGITGAQYALGELLAADGPTRNLKAAYHWYKLAADGGNPAAQYALSLILANGLGVDADRATGLLYLGLAYCAGFPAAREMVDSQAGGAGRFPCADSQPSDLAGVWSGELTRAAANGDGTAGPPLSVRLTLRADDVAVEVRQGEAWTAVEPGGFHLERRQGTAVATSIDDGWDFDGHWVEAWTFTLVRVDADTLAATCAHTVENLQVPAAVAWRTTSDVSTGRLHRAPAAPGG